MENINFGNITSAGDRYNEWSLWHLDTLSPEVFIGCFRNNIEKILNKRGVGGSLVIDQYNQHTLHNMYYYAVGSPLCEWDINKGLFLGGKVGAGKTLLMSAFLKILEDISGYVIEMIPARQLAQKLIDNGPEYYMKRPLFIDELGRENLEENYYGRTIRPFEELMSYRYEYGSRLFVTSNFTPERLGQGFDENGKRIGYGSYILDRMKETMSFDVLPGSSRR